jgi:hypothetical protein
VLVGHESAEQHTQAASEEQQSSVMRN